MKERILVTIVFIIMCLTGFITYEVGLNLIPEIVKSSTLDDDSFYKRKTENEESESEYYIKDMIIPEEVNNTTIRGNICKKLKINYYDEYIEGTDYRVRDIIYKHKKKIIKEMDEQVLSSLEYYGYINANKTPTVILRSKGVYSDMWHYTKIVVDIKRKKIISVSYPIPEIFYKDSSVTNTGMYKKNNGNITNFIYISNEKDYNDKVKSKVKSKFKDYVFENAFKYSDYSFVNYSKGVIRLKAKKLNNDKDVILKFKYNKDSYFIGNGKYKISHSCSYEGEEKIK